MSIGFFLRCLHRLDSKGTEVRRRADQDLAEQLVKGKLQWAGLALVVLALTLNAGPARAQSYPTRPIRLITPSSPGSGVDIIARIVGQQLSKALGQQVIIDNRPGAGANLGAEIAAKAQPDGYTLLMATAAQVIHPSLPMGGLGYDTVRDFAPVSLVSTGQFIVLVHPSLPVNALRDLIGLARARPGELNYASGGNGSTPHLAAALFSAAAKIRMTHIPYKGSGPALTDLIAGQVQVMFANLAAGLPHVKAGRLRAVAVTGLKRSPAAPELPTVQEEGLPGYVVTWYFGVMVPFATPRHIIDQLNREIVKVMALPEMRSRLELEGAEPASSTPSEFAAFIHAEIAKWAKAVKAAGLSAANGREK